ncbi:MAG: DUF885 family protein [Gemmatimonadota bacterium]
MRAPPRPLLPIAGLIAALAAGPGFAQGTPLAGNRYEDLVALFDDWRSFQRPVFRDGVPDYTPAAMRAQHQRLPEFQRRLAGIDPSAWPVTQQVDYHLVRAEMNGLDFDHRVMRPWSRMPGFYKVVLGSQTDVPAREGSVMHGAIELWTYDMPLDAQREAELRARIQAIPAILAQAKGNLTEDARDLWFTGIRFKQSESRVLTSFAARAAAHHPELAQDAERARAAVDDFRTWLEAEYPSRQGRSGIGVENYDWHLKNVQLVPHTWADQVAIVQRELDRSWAYLQLAENRNRSVPQPQPVATQAEYEQRYRQAVTDFIAFLDTAQIMTVEDYAEPALLAREGRFSPPPWEFFSEVNNRDLRPMRAHGTHWFDLARLEQEQHASPIRRVPALYNLWAYRAEGLATGFEEMVMEAGYLDEPRVRELVWILLAQRAARAMAELRMHSNEFTLQDAVDYAVKWTPRGWLAVDGSTVWGEQALYLEQPAYGTSYVVGKVDIENIITERARQLGSRFNLRSFMDGFHASGLIPLSLIRWEMTGLDDQIRALQ